MTQKDQNWKPVFEIDSERFGFSSLRMPGPAELLEIFQGMGNFRIVQYIKEEEFEGRTTVEEFNPSPVMTRCAKRDGEYIVFTRTGTSRKSTQTALRLLRNGTIVKLVFEADDYGHDIAFCFNAFWPYYNSCKKNERANLFLGDLRLCGEANISFDQERWFSGKPNFWEITLSGRMEEILGFSDSVLTSTRKAAIDKISSQLIEIVNDPETSGTDRAEIHVMIDAILDFMKSKYWVKRKSC